LTTQRLSYQTCQRPSKLSSSRPSFTSPRSLFSDKTPENSDKTPEHKRRMEANVQVKAEDDARGDKGSPKTARTSKVVNPFTRALAPPFIGRRRDFYIPTLPLNSKNIPSVNTHTNVFYISYIYKPATSSHVEPGLFETTTLTLLLASS
jgi:hypothetical protein